MLSLRELRQEVTPGSFSFDETDFTASNKNTLIGLNNRLQEHLKKVKDLSEKNNELQKQINEAKDKEAHGQYWEQIPETLEVEKLQIKTITEQNAEKLQMINFWTKEEKKLEEEVKSNSKLMEELKDLEKVLDETKQTKELLQEEIEDLNSKLLDQTTQHKTKVDDLCENLPSKDDSQNPNLADIVKDIRKKYDEIIQKNTKETNDWYKNKLNKAKEEEAQNLKELESKKSELMEQMKQKKILEIEIKTHRSTNRSLEVTLKETRQRVSNYHKKRGDLVKMLGDLIKETEEQQRKNRELLDINDNLQEQIQRYGNLVDSKKDISSQLNQEEENDLNEPPLAF